MQHSWFDGPKPELPKITDEDLLLRTRQFQHIKRDGKNFKTVNTSLEMEYLRQTSCIWDPVLGNKVEMVDLLPTSLPFPVSCGFYGFFKPSIAEVMAAVSPELFDHLKAEGYNAFYIESKVDIHESGSIQVGTAIFVRITVDD